MHLARSRTGPVQRWRWRALLLMSVALSAILTTALWAAHLHAPFTHAAGSLSFAPHVDYPALVVPGGDPRTSVAIGDLNHDGKPDLVTTSPNTAVVHVLLGSGAGAFGPALPYGVSFNPTSVAIADFNDDMNLDLAVGDGLGVDVLLGNGTGSFAAPVTYPAVDPIVGPTRVVVAGDLTGDGKPDLATANVGPGTVSVLPNNGVGGFGAPVTYFVGFNVSSVTIGDFNADRLLDLAAADLTSNSVYVLRATPAGNFSLSLPFPVGVFPSAMAAGDLNGDGRSDLAVAESGDVSLLLSDATTNSLVPAPGFPIAGGPTSVAIGDFDSDGKPDVVAADGNNSTVDVALNAGDGHLLPPPIFPVGGYAGSVTAGDLNGDRKPDIVTSNSSPWDVSVLLNTTVSGAPTPTPTPITGSGNTDVTLTLSGGELSATTNSAPTLSATLTGQDQTLTYTLPISVTDATASGAGWNLTLSSTQFTTGGATPHTLPADASRVSGATAACADPTTCVPPLNNVSYPLGVPAGVNAPAVKLFNAAANSGLGAFTITPTVSVFVPASAVAGTYTSTLTLAIVSGP